MKMSQMFLAIVALTWGIVSSQTGHASPEGIPNFQKVTDNIYRGGRPSSSDLSQLADDGIRTVINLENDRQAVSREEQRADKLNIQFVSSPMSWNRSPSDHQVDTILRLMKSSKNYPLFIHCKQGRDRSGMIVGLYRVLVQGWSPKDAYKEMLDLGFRPKFKALDSYFKRRSGY